MEQLEGTPGVLPFEVYSQAPLRLISWCSFELPRTARKLLREFFFSVQRHVASARSFNSYPKTVANEINYLIRTGAVAVVAARVNWKRTDT